MNNDIFLKILNKRKRHILQPHKEYDDFPVIFPGMAGSADKKNIFAIGRDLKVKKQEEITKNPKKEEESNNFLLAKSLNMGYYLITPLLLGVFFGYWLDNLFKTKPLFLLSLFFLGTVGSFYNLWKTVKEAK